MSEPSSEKLRALVPRQAGVMLKIWPRLLVSVLLGGMFAWLANRGGIPLLPAEESYQNVRWELVLGSFLLYGGATWVRAARWRWLVRPVAHVPLAEVLRLNWIGFFAIFALPLRLGEFVRPSLCKLRLGLPVSMGLGTVAVERVLDGLLTSGCVALSLLLLPRRTPVDDLTRVAPIYAVVVLAVFVGGLIALAGFLWQRERTAKLVQTLVGPVSPRLADGLSDKVASLADGLRSLGNARFTSAFVAESLVYWSAIVASCWVLGQACGLPMSFGVAAAVVGMLALGILLPGGPGMFGSFQIATGAALKLYFSAELVAAGGAVFVFLLYSIHALVISTLGIVQIYRTDLSLSQMLEDRQN